MKTRVLTGIVLAVVLLPLLFVPEWFFYIFIGLLALIASYEMFHMFQSVHTLPKVMVIYQGLATISLYGFVLGSYLGWIMFEGMIMLLMLLTLVGLMLTVLVKQYRPQDFGRSVLSILYLGLCFSAISLVRSLGIVMLGYMLILTMVTDMFAYFIGMRFGRHRLAPTISPKKSVEGAIGGTIVAVLIASIYAFFFEIYPFNNPIILLIIIVSVGVFVSIISQIGDLVASRLKREHGIKDFSNLFPGHGGVLDRFDSTMFAALALMIVMMIIEVF